MSIEPAERKKPRTTAIAVVVDQIPADREADLVEQLAHFLLILTERQEPQPHSLD